MVGRETGSVGREKGLVDREKGLVDRAVALERIGRPVRGRGW